ARDDDLVALAPLSGDRPGKREVQRRHVGAEDHLARRAAEERAGSEPRVGNEPLGAPTSLVRSTDIRVRLAQVDRDRLDHLVRHLRAARAVEEGKVAAEGREACPSRDDIEGDGAHDPTLATSHSTPCVLAASVQTSLWLLNRERT